MTLTTDQICSPQCQAGRWTHGPFPVVGLVGGIGAGKSLVAGELARRGAVVFDADSLAHEVLQQESVARDLVARFGESIRGTAGSIDRKALGAIVFADSHARSDLESIVHPRLRARFEKVLWEPLAEGAVAVMLDAALLLEAGWDDLCDLIVFVDAPREVRLDRVVKSRGWSRAEFERREQAQWPLADKRSRADFVVPNDNGSDLRGPIDRIWTKIFADPNRSQSTAASLGLETEAVESRGFV